MVNVGFSWSSLLGIVLAVAGAALYFLRSVRPSLARDHDIFFAAVGLLCGGILFFQGWRQDPILQFGQFLLTGSAIFFAVESIRLRNVATQQAKRNTPIVDDERPVSQVYYRVDAELDDRLEPVEEQPPRRRIRGTPDPRNTRRDVYEDDVPRRRPSSRPSSDRPSSPPDSQRKRRPRPSTERPVTERPTTDYTPDEYDQWETPQDPEDRPARRPSNSTRPTTRPATGSKSRPSRPPQENRSRRDRDNDEIEATPTDYVEYKPVDYPDDEELDNNADFDN